MTRNTNKCDSVRGFECPSDDNDVRQLKSGRLDFLLQDYYVEDGVNNFTMNLHVQGAQLWCEHMQPSGLIDNRPRTRVSEPELEDWDMIVMHAADWAGVS